MLMQNKWKAFVGSAGYTVAVVALGIYLSAGSMQQYEGLYKPPLAPPGWLFPVVWTILYILMAIASWKVALSLDPDRGKALLLYRIQLVVNILWPVFFFRLERYWLAFLWLALLWILVKKTIEAFSEVNMKAGQLMIPYIYWITYAVYLNLAYALHG